MSTLLRALLVLLTINVYACRPPEGEMDEGGSSLKWGHLRYDQGSGNNWLTNIGPKDQIELCGDSPEKLELAVRKWADAIGRGKYFNFAKCNQATAAKKIKLTMHINYTQYPCTINGVQGATTTNDGVIRICSNLAVPESYVILHEVGHMWGMCDMYPGQTQNCDSKNMTQIDNSAIMGNGSVKDNPDLTQDDKNGVIAMAARPEFATVKKAWDDYVATNPTPGGSTPTPPTTPTGTSSGNANDIFVALDAADSAGNGFVWVAANAQVATVLICRGDLTICGPGKPAEGYRFDRAALAVTTRNFFRSSVAIPVAGYAGKLTLMGFDAANNMVASNVIEVRKK